MKVTFGSENESGSGGAVTDGGGASAVQGSRVDDTLSITTSSPSSMTPTFPVTFREPPPELEEGAFGPAEDNPSDGDDDGEAEGEASTTEASED